MKRALAYASSAAVIMIIVEYRVPMPFSAHEYRVGQLYTIAMKSKLDSADASNGVRINANEPYANGPGGTCGQYTDKTYYLSSKMPDWLKRVVPDSAAQLREQAWNAYPYTRNKFTNPLLGDSRLTLEIESRYVDGPPDVTNVFGLSADEQSARQITTLDFVQDEYLLRHSDPSSSSSSTVAAAIASSERICSRVTSGKAKLLSAANITSSRLKKQRSQCTGYSFDAKSDNIIIDAHTKPTTKTTRNNNNNKLSGVGSADMLKFEPLFRQTLTRDWLQARTREYKNIHSDAVDQCQTNKSTNDADDEARTHTYGSKTTADESFVDDDGDSLDEAHRLMTCYKLCKVHFPVWPLQTRVEQFIQNYCRDTILEAHRQTWLWQDEWTGLNMTDIRNIEADTQKYLTAMMGGQLVAHDNNT